MRQLMMGNRPWLLAATAVLLVVLAVLYFMGPVLLVLGLSLVIAYVLLPVVRLLERGLPWRRDRPYLARGAAVGVIYLAALALLAGFLITAVPRSIEQGQQFADDFPTFLKDARVTIEGWTDRYTEVVPQDARDQIEAALADAGDIVGRTAWNVLKQSLGVIAGSFSFVLALATAPVLVFYLMKDSGLITRSMRAPFPATMRPYFQDIMAIADRTMGGYIRGQLTLGLVVGTIVAVGLLLLDIPFAVVLGIVAGLTELVPIIGPWIGGAVGVLVTLATEPDKVLWVILLYLAIQLLENTLLVPRIQSKTLNLHPIAVILIITVGSHYFGLWGVILGPPLVALGKDLTIYFAQQWGSPLALAAEADTADAPTPVEAAAAEEPTVDPARSEE